LKVTKAIIITMCLLGGVFLLCASMCMSLRMYLWVCLGVRVCLYVGVRHKSKN